MLIINLITLVAGLFVLSIGLATFINPDFSRLINIPFGTTNVKAIITIFVGTIVIVIGIFFL